MTFYGFLNIFQIILMMITGIVYSLLIEKFLQKQYRKEREKWTVDK